MLCCCRRTGGLYSFGVCLSRGEGLGSEDLYGVIGNWMQIFYFLDRGNHILFWRPQCS